MTKANHREEDEDEDDEEQEPITREQFYRNLMSHPSDDEEDAPESQKKKKQPKGKQTRSNRPHDNRDQLPFLVQVLTPPKEPYEQQALQRLQQQQQQQQQTNKKSKKKNKKKEKDFLIKETLGEYRFEKNTSSGDKIEIDNQVYVVQKAKAQFKYAGAQKFVMVRKILQVKPIQRAMQEDYILRQWNASPAPESE